MPKSLLPWILVSQRLGIALLTLVIVSFAVFFATELLPGDVAEILLGQAATPEAVAGLRTSMGLDEPAMHRFAGWLFGLAGGDMGTSYVNKMAVSDLMGGRLVNSLRLSGVTTLVSVPIALALGIGAAMLKCSMFDRVLSVATISVISVPEFMVATLAVLIFAVWLGWLPALAYG
ncbi:MAG: ABC transporter permease, partial [Donghicola eburneus]